jgi:DNA-binding transcriptional LysR family regulator
MNEHAPESIIAPQQPPPPEPPRLESLEDVAVFRQVVDAGSVGAAAGFLGRSAKWVSRRLARLEACTGAELLRRTTRSQAITEAGRILYERSGSLLALAEATAAALDVDERQVRGRLDVSMPDRLAYFGGAAAVGHWLDEHPGASVHLRVDRAERIRLPARDVGGGLWITTEPPRDGSVRVEPLGTTTWCLAADPGYLYDASVPDTPHDLAEHQCLSVGADLRHPTTWRLEHSTSGELVGVPARGALASDDTGALMSALYGGAGIGCVPTWWWSRDALAMLPNAPLERVLPSWRVVPTQVFAVCRPREAVTPLVRSFLAAMRVLLAAWCSSARGVHPPNRSCACPKPRV